MTQRVAGRPVVDAISTFRPEMAFPFLTEEMLVRLADYGKEEANEAGSLLWHHGDREVDMFVVLSGAVEVSAQDDKGETVSLTVLRTRQFTGELDLLSSRGTLVDGRTLADSLLLRIPRPQLQRLMRSEGDIANLIMQATVWRRLGIVERATNNVVLLGQSNAANTLRLQQFLTRNSYPHLLLEPTPEQFADDAANTQEQYRLPAVIFPGGRVLHQPTLAELADELGLTELLDPEMTYDLAVIGAGPSGLAAAVYGASEGLTTIAIEGIAPGGQAGTSSKIENYLGFPTGVSGQELATRAQVQAQKFGARLAVARDVTRVDTFDGVNLLTLTGGATIRARAVVIATGAQYRKLTLKNYERFEGQGIQYAATALEAAHCLERDVVVVGGGNSAGQAAVFLSGSARHVHLVARAKDLAGTMSQYLVARICSSKRITVHLNCEVQSLEGDTVLRSVTVRERHTGACVQWPVASIFVMIGAEPNSGWLYGTLALDNKGFIVTEMPNGLTLSRFATSVSGLFAIGDVRAGSTKRVASAVGEGSAVIADVHRYLASYRKSKGQEALSIRPAENLQELMYVTR